MVIDRKDNDISWINCVAENKAHKDLLLINSGENIFKKPRPEGNTPTDEQLLINTSNCYEGTWKLSLLACVCLTFFSDEESRRSKGDNVEEHRRDLYILCGISVFWFIDRRPNYTVKLTELGCNALAFTPVFNCWSCQLVACRTEGGFSLLK